MLNLFASKKHTHWPLFLSMHDQSTQLGVRVGAFTHRLVYSVAHESSLFVPANISAPPGASCPMFTSGFGNFSAPNLHRGKPITKQRLSNWKVDAITLVYSSSGLCILPGVLQPLGPCLGGCLSRISVLQLAVHCPSHLQGFIMDVTSQLVWQYGSLHIP